MRASAASRETFGARPVPLFTVASHGHRRRRRQHSCAAGADVELRPLVGWLRSRRRSMTPTLRFARGSSVGSGYEGEGTPGEASRRCATSRGEVRVPGRDEDEDGSHPPEPEGAKSRVRSRKRARAEGPSAPWRRRESRSHRAARPTGETRRDTTARVSASARRPGAFAFARARARQEKEDDSPEIETARPAPRERRTPSRRARDGGRDGVEKGTRAGSRARTSTRRRERARAVYPSTLVPSRALHAGLVKELSVSCVSSMAAPSDTPVRPPAFAVSDRPTRSGPRRGGVPSPLPGGMDTWDARRPSARAGVRRHRQEGAREIPSRTRLAPRRRPSRAPLERRIPSRRPPLDRGGAEGARRVVADRRARRDATVVRLRLWVRPSRREGRAGLARGFVWDGEEIRGEAFRW